MNDITVFYLEMLARPAREVAAPRQGLSVVLKPTPTLAYYRQLYDAVGKNYNWQSRLKMSDDVLAAIIGDPLDEIYVLQVDGVPAGFAELDRRKSPEIELTQFGLMPDFIGQGLGKWFLQWAIDKAWSYEPRRLWLHTCTEDHPAALPNYLKSGFALFNQKVVPRTP